MVSMPRPMTADELSTLHIPNKRTELQRGRLVVSEPPGMLHADITARICTALSVFVRRDGRDTGRRAGTVVAGDPGFWIERNPDTVRAPDVAYIAPARMPVPAPVGFATCAPSIAVEVLSPNDRASEVRDKVEAWLRAGAELVWVVDGLTRSAQIHRTDGSWAVLERTDALDGEGVLPGFLLPLADLFD